MKLNINTGQSVLHSPPRKRSRELHHNAPYWMKSIFIGN